MEPLLEKAKVENAAMMKTLAIKNKEADAKKVICEADEKECNIQSEAANILKTSCQADLDKVLPILYQAQDAISKIDKKDMDTLKSFTNPPKSAAVVMEGVCYVFGCDNEVKF